MGPSVKALATRIAPGAGCYSVSVVRLTHLTPTCGFSAGLVADSQNDSTGASKPQVRKVRYSGRDFDPSLTALTPNTMRY
jgi:hypothetical protein